jgi:hypothetical protein
MLLGPYVDRLRHELAMVAEAGGEEARALAERLVAPLDSAVRLVLLEALAAAADAITRELAPGSVHLRLQGRDPAFVVAPAPADGPADDRPVVAPPAAADAKEGETNDGTVARINFRPPEHLKVRIEEAAAQDGLSVNAWLVRATSAALEPGTRRRSESRRSGSPTARYTGWAG